MEATAKIYIAGHRGMVGSAIHRNLLKRGFTNFIFKTSAELDLRNSQAVSTFFEAEKPDYVFLAAAKVGGIQANNIYRAEFLYDKGHFYVGYRVMGYRVMGVKDDKI